jgi:hypothetical protein
VLGQEKLVAMLGTAKPDRAPNTGVRWFKDPDGNCSA